MVVTAVVKHWRIYMKKTSTLNYSLFYIFYIGVRECFAFPNFGQYKSEREGFMFHKEENYYQCTKPEGNQAKLLFKGEKGIVKATPNERTEVAKQIAKTVH